MKRATANGNPNASRLITRQIDELGDWRGKAIARLRALIIEAVPDIEEDWKWGTAVWTHNGMVCSAGAFKDHVKLNFFKGASLKDPKHLFNAGLDAKAMRAIDFAEGDKIDSAGIKGLFRRAVALNRSAGGRK